MRAIISVFGKDRPGIIAGLSAVLYRHGSNILDISQTILQDFFTMIMIVDLTDCPLDFVTLRDEMGQIGQTIGVVISCQHEDIFQYMHRI